ncbi:MAG: FHA domain-containing protein [Verrucomicrobiia bacterium]
MYTRGTLVWKKTDGTRVRFVVTDKPTVVGRGEDADVHIEEEGVSRRHFVVTPRGDSFFVEDMNSTNGTWVNDQRLVEPHELKVFDRIRAGVVLFVFDKEFAPPIPTKKPDTPK